MNKRLRKKRNKQNFVIYEMMKERVCGELDEEAAELLRHAEYVELPDFMLTEEYTKRMFTELMERVYRKAGAENALGIKE